MPYAGVMSSRSLAAVALLAAAALLGGCSLPGRDEGGGGPPDWAPAGEAKITPGAQTRTNGGQCTANFVFYEGDTVYLGQAAHCSTTGGPASVDGCKTSSRPLGTKIRIEGAGKPGTLAYNSWLAMRKAGETDSETCKFNDLALIELDPEEAKKVNPSIPKFGGPTGIGTTAKGQQVYTYGSSELRLGIKLLSPKSGVTVETSPAGWSHTVYTLTPGIPGDSGSAMLNRKGEALGVISTLAFLGKPGSNGVGDIGKELAYARAHGFPDLELARGTEKFRASFLGLG